MQPVLLKKSSFEPLTYQGAVPQHHSGLQGLYLLAVGQTKAGLAVGTTTSAALLLLDIKRAYDVGEAYDQACCPAHQRITPLTHPFRPCACLCYVAVRSHCMGCLGIVSSLKF